MSPCIYQGDIGERAKDTLPVMNHSPRAYAAERKDTPHVNVDALDEWQVSVGLEKSNGQIGSME